MTLQARKRGRKKRRKLRKNATWGRGKDTRKSRGKKRREE
jgi:hypothetical protein